MEKNVALLIFFTPLEFSIAFSRNRKELVRNNRLLRVVLLAGLLVPVQLEAPVVVFAGVVLVVVREEGQMERRVTSWNKNN